MGSLESERLCADRPVLYNNLFSVHFDRPLSPRTVRGKCPLGVIFVQVNRLYHCIVILNPSQAPKFDILTGMHI